MILLRTCLFIRITIETAVGKVAKYEWTSNPIALAYYTDDKRSQYTTFGNVFAEYEFLQDHSLKFKTNLGIDLNLYHNKAFNQNFVVTMMAAVRMWIKVWVDKTDRVTLMNHVVKVSH